MTEKNGTLVVAITLYTVDQGPRGQNILLSVAIDGLILLRIKIYSPVVTKYVAMSLYDIIVTLYSWTLP